MRVSLVTFDHGESMVALAGALARHATVQLVVPEGQLAPFRDELNSEVRLVAFPKPRYRQAAQQARMVTRILREVRRFGPDLVHLQQGHPWFNLALPALRGVPLVLTVHDPRPHPGDVGGRRNPQFLTDRAIRRADRLIAHAEHVKATLTAGWGLRPDRVDVIPLAFGWRPATPADALLPAPRLLFFGRIWPYKGLETLIAAEPLVSARVPGVEIVIAGEGEDFGRYRRMMAHPERFRVEYGFVPVQRRERLFGEASAVVLPYLEATQSGVLPLAYRHSRPVVATTVGGLPEVVVDGKTGFLVPPDDATALADAAVRLLGDPGLRAAMGTSAREAFEAVHAPGPVAAATVEVYERLLAGPGRGGGAG
jgi:glycosyltransferase involved in cell wall biosynthesis